jgi:hypothetical protein
MPPCGDLGNRNRSQAPGSTADSASSSSALQSQPGIQPKISHGLDALSSPGAMKTSGSKLEGYLQQAAGE